jgi:hypothetical protein
MKRRAKRAPALTVREQVLCQFIPLRRFIGLGRTWLALELGLDVGPAALDLGPELLQLIHGQLSVTVGINEGGNHEEYRSQLRQGAE